VTEETRDSCENSITITLLCLWAAEKQ